MEIFYILGEALANLINISPTAARGLLKLSIKDQFGPFKPLNEIIYKDFKLTITNSLKYRLESLKISNPDDIINILLDNLSRNQSLFTTGRI